MARRADAGESVRAARLLGVLVVLGLAAAIVVVVLALGSGPGSSAGASPSPGAADLVLVERVVDGDTIIVEVDGRRARVRFIGVDAPELSPAECGAVAAAEATARLLEGRTVELERDTSDRDRFDRLLRHVWVVGDGTRSLVTERLVADGVMEARSYPPDTRYDRRLEAAERVARAAGNGIWGAC